MNVEEETLRRVMREEISQIIDDKSGTFRRVVREEVNQAMDAKLDTRFASFESSIDARFANFETKLAKFFGDTHRYFDKRFNKLEKQFNKKLDAMQTSVDGIVGRLDDDDVERAAMNAQLNRHEINIGELARHTGAKLSEA
jgi:Skp family chaperone for outer membrane proteins